ncbi:DPP IV N-terminal domain-containing protein [Muricauda ruestringensis]|uniref:DPP IV N-terminal domain-containing protein n=1 Tax=Flagellimonas aurea TaxID=2915619 RepID=A0ABS3G6P9_9FLAO|nr:S9 family peptidase [Allomuricauda aurea]MBO0355098.1 DPP IV N-terminal domain-containing protein [Allomuricauda aurea]
MESFVKKISVFFILVNFGTSFAQGTLAEYQKAISLDSLFRDKVTNSPKNFHWQKNNLLWYVNNTPDGKEYLWVNPSEKTQEKCFDHAVLAKLLSEKFEKDIDANHVDISELEFDFDMAELKFTFDEKIVSFNPNQQELTIVESKTEDPKRDWGYWGSRFDETNNPPVMSPDSTMLAFIKNHNLYIKNTSTDEETRLSYDGAPGFFYSTYIKWSPDGKKIMAYKVRPGDERKIYFVESSPEDQFQPKLQSRDYLKPGDELPFKSPQLFLIGEKKHIQVPTDEFGHQFGLNNIEWREDSSAFTFEYNQRGHQAYKVIAVDAITGAVKVLVNEVSKTFIDYNGKKYRYDIDDGKEIIWTSERDGWNHIYLYDGETGKVKRQLTKGEWVVRNVIHVDEENREVYFTASGMDKGQDPYFLHYFKVGFDGRNLTRFTKENGNHQLTFSEDYEYYVDQYSRVDAPPVTLLKSSKNAKTLMQLQKADHSALLQEGWIAPEVFTSKGRDGVTDIWGVIIRPTSFDPNKTYPVIEYIYAGPHSSFVPKDFRSYYWSMSSLAELGFIVVQIDGMGTSNRSKAFHDVCWKNLKDGGFPDRKIWIREAAKKYPYMDAENVGIFGTSAGGQNAAAALVFNSDFYDVAVSSCGCHDNRMDKIWWNEQFMGYPIGPHYAECSNVENAGQMGGDLMLILGEVDDNVDPASTMQFANALIKANKDFELVTIPGMGHSSGGEFGERKRKDFFVKHLMDVDPPSWEEIYN